MDQARAPVLEALQAYRDRGDVTFGPPGHRRGLGADPRVREILGDGVFASDVLMLNGLDDRRMSQGILEKAESLMAEAVRAEKAFFSTCGTVALSALWLSRSSEVAPGIARAMPFSVTRNVLIP